jgi:hypothetical protein
MGVVSRSPLISTGSRGAFRTLMTSVSFGEISTAFRDEGFAPAPDCTYDDSSVRRSAAQSYLEAVDWTDPSHVTRALHAFERVLLTVRPDAGSSYVQWDAFVRAMRRDQYAVEHDGHIRRLGPEPALPESALAQLKDPALIREQLDRIQRTSGDDPALTIGSAKELIEATARTVLEQRGEPVSQREDVQTLIRRAQQALLLHPSNVTEGPDGTEAVKKILGGATAIALGVVELRNRGYGTGHAGRRTGLAARHASLAVNAATTWCQLALDTLNDKHAPWRTERSPHPAQPASNAETRPGS